MKAVGPFLDHHCDLCAVKGIEKIDLDLDLNGLREERDSSENLITKINTNVVPINYSSLPVLTVKSTT